MGLYRGSTVYKFVYHDFVLIHQALSDYISLNLETLI